MAVSNIKALIPGELQKVWELVLNTENYAAWRSDLSKTEAISDKQFIEYTRIDEVMITSPIFNHEDKLKSILIMKDVMDAINK